MAREFSSPIARNDSQLMHRCSWESATAWSGPEWIDRNGREVEALGAARTAVDNEAIARQGLAADDLPEIVCKMLQRREAARLGVQMNEIETPAAALASAVFAHETIEPALQAAGQVEICTINGEYERFIQHTGVKPVGQDQLQSAWPAVHICRLFPFIDPGKAMPPAFRRLADRRHDGRRLQPVERGF
jgi:hypothetical protein